MIKDMTLGKGFVCIVIPDIIFSVNLLIQVSFHGLVHSLLLSSKVGEPPGF